MNIRKQSKPHSSTQSIAKLSSDSDSAGGGFSQLLITYKRWILMAEVIIILGLGYVLLIAPQLQFDTGADGQSLAHWEQQLVTAEQALIDAQTLVTLYNKLSVQDLQKLDMILPAEQDVPILMSQLEALFLSEELFLTDLSAFHLENSLLAPPGMQILSVKISFLAPQSYSMYKDLLTKLESNVRMLDIQTVEYSPGNNAFLIEAFAYFRE